jgi:hypothetical protein
VFQKRGFSQLGIYVYPKNSSLRTRFGSQKEFAKPHSQIHTVFLKGIKNLRDYF